MLKKSEIEKLEKLKSELGRAHSRRGRKKKRGRVVYRTRRTLSSLELETSAAQRRRLESQGVRPAAGADRFPPGDVVSVKLACGHRTRVEALASGLLPARAKCPTCRRWSNTDVGSARQPRQNASRRVVAERVETRDGREFTVRVLATPRRARMSTTKRRTT
jgi:ssDNA-binding Zn-finger/Zn-ribbon topoisomerase 1